MNGLPYYKAYPRDFVEGTIGLPFEIKCAYRVVIDLIYMQGGKLPDDARYISGLLGCSMRKWTSIRAALVEIGKLHVSGEFLTNYRADKELETLAKLQDKQRENATGPRKNNDIPKPRLNHTEPDTDTERKRKNPPTPQGGIVVVDPSSSEFEKVWPHYPRHVGKAQAAKAWDKARKRASYDQIASALRACIKAWANTPPDKIPHFATWLNRDGWLDDPGHAANRPRTSTEDIANLSRISSADDVASLFAGIPQLRIAK